MLANPETVLNAKYAPKAVREQVIRADGLIDYIKRSNAQRDAVDHGEKQMLELAEYFLAKHTESKVDYLEKYRRLAEEFEGAEREVTTKVEGTTIDALPCSSYALKPQESLSDAPPRCPKCGSVMLKRTALKGTNAGIEFWGCPGFTNCKGVLGIK